MPNILQQKLAAPKGLETPPYAAIPATGTPPQRAGGTQGPARWGSFVARTTWVSTRAGAQPSTHISVLGCCRVLWMPQYFGHASNQMQSKALTAHIPPSPGAIQIAHAIYA